MAYGEWHDTGWMIRAGAANPDVSEAAWFASATLERRYRLITAGLGTAVTGASDKLGADTDDAWTSELYLIHDLNGAVHIGPHLQDHHNPGFDITGSSVDRSQWVADLRASVLF